MFLLVNGENINLSHVGIVETDLSSLEITYIFENGKQIIQKFTSSVDFTETLDKLTKMVV
jgi:hypothetical protein